jgi:hypothetical protein
MKRTVTSPKSKALWLINHTSLTFNQIAEFCSLHPMEIKSIADNIMHNTLQEKSPVICNETTRESIEKCEKNPSESLEILSYNLDPSIKITIKKHIYTGISKRQNKPSAILWLIANIPNITINEIRSITGCTKLLAEAIINKTHSKINEITPKDPASLGLCTQSQLNTVINLHKKPSNEH